MAKLGEVSQKLDWTKLGPRERLLGGVTVAVVLFGMYFLLILPKKAEVGQREARVTLLAGEIIQATAINQQLRTRIQALQEVKKGKEVAGDIPLKALDILPGSSELSSLLEELTQLARQRQVEVVTIRPESVEHKQAYVQMNLRIDVKARFLHLGEYLMMLEDLPRAIIVEDMKVETTPETAPIVMGHLRAMTFMATR